jgi:hypothetical protein
MKLAKRTFVKNNRTTYRGKVLSMDGWTLLLHKPPVVPKLSECNGVSGDHALKTSCMHCIVIV